SFSILFAGEKQARLAKQVIESGQLESSRAQIVLKTKKSVLTVEVSAQDFTALRAVTTSFLRDCKVALDSFNAVNNSNTSKSK
ncbi:hypothetical protein HY993_01300, partial [Candidatus Micrarchaeota archaeon]|nr:hypothetical protein [Candidatus Micrarchaeota archaeon]